MLAQTIWMCPAWLLRNIFHIKVCFVLHAVFIRRKSHAFSACPHWHSQSSWIGNRPLYWNICAAMALGKNTTTYHVHACLVMYWWIHHVLVSAQPWWNRSLKLCVPVCIYLQMVSDLPCLSQRSLPEFVCDSHDRRVAGCLRWAFCYETKTMCCAGQKRFRAVHKMIQQRPWVVVKPCCGHQWCVITHAKAWPYLVSSVQKCRSYFPAHHHGSSTQASNCTTIFWALQSQLPYPLYCFNNLFAP